MSDFNPSARPGQDPGRKSNTGRDDAATAFDIAIEWAVSQFAEFLRATAHGRWARASRHRRLLREHGAQVQILPPEGGLDR